MRGLPPAFDWRPLCLSAGLGVAYSVGLALGVTLLIEALQTGGDWSRFIEHTLGQALALTFVSALVVWIIVVLIWGITGRLSLTTFVVLVLTVLLGLANNLKLTLRREPIYPDDVNFLVNPGFLADVVDVSSAAAALTFVVGLAVVVWQLNRLLKRKIPLLRQPRGRIAWPVSATIRIVTIVLALSFLNYAASFHSRDNRLRSAFEASGADWAFWYQKTNYLRNGFVPGVLYNLNVPAMQRPPGYSKRAMLDIVERYSRVTDGDDITQSRPVPVGIERPNIVLVLSEAFSDPSNLEGVAYERDPIPFTRDLMGETTSGTMLAQLFGGGTANVEFEALTGMSLAMFNPQLTSPYHMLIPEHRRFPSVVGYLGQRGYRTVAIHPYMTTMYKRELVYPILGFDEFIGEDELPDADKLERSQFISDASAFQEVRRQLVDTEEPLFVNLVTMQNHVPMEGSYREPLALKGVTGEFLPHLENYGRGLEYTDQALRELIRELDGYEEPTVVVFYGDHLPGVWPQSVFDRNGEQRMRETPYFMWTNFDSQRLSTQRLLSPIHFLPQAFEIAGMERPPYYLLLRRLREHIPAMAQGEYFDASGRHVSTPELSPPARQVLRDYRLVQYDLSVGHRWSATRLFYPIEDPGEGSTSARSAP